MGVENTVGKGEIARYEQFLLFPQCFLKACFPGASKGIIVWEWVKTQIPLFSCVVYKYFQFEHCKILSSDKDFSTFDLDHSLFCRGLVLTNKVLDREESAIHHLSLNVFSSGMVVINFMFIALFWVCDT